MVEPDLIFKDPKNDDHFEKDPVAMQSIKAAIAYMFM